VIVVSTLHSSISAPLVLSCSQLMTAPADSAAHLSDSPHETSNWRRAETVGRRICTRLGEERAPVPAQSRPVRPAVVNLRRLFRLVGLIWRPSSGIGQRRWLYPLNCLIAGCWRWLQLSNDCNYDRRLHAQLTDQRHRHYRLLPATWLLPCRRVYRIRDWSRPGPARHQPSIRGHCIFQQRTHAGRAAYPELGDPRRDTPAVLFRVSALINATVDSHEEIRTRF